MDQYYNSTARLKRWQVNHLKLPSEEIQLQWNIEWRNGITEFISPEGNIIRLMQKLGRDRSGNIPKLLYSGVTYSITAMYPMYHDILLYTNVLIVVVTVSPY